MRTQIKTKFMETGKKWILAAALALLAAVWIGEIPASAADRTLQNKKWASGEGGVFVDSDKDGVRNFYQSNGIAYYKLKIPKQGYIIVDVKTSALPGQKEYDDHDREEWENDPEPWNNEEYEKPIWHTEVKVLDSKKKGRLYFDNEISLENKVKKNYTFSVAVKKGTYYLAVDSGQKYKIRYQFTPVAKVDKAGKSFKKALALKKGKTVKSLYFGEEYTHQYYKIKLTKKSKVTLSFDFSKLKATDGAGLSDDDASVSLFVKKGNDYWWVVNNKGKASNKDIAIWWDMSGKEKHTWTLPKGTYYVRIWSSITTGYYTMTWK